jgi:hypothetical protein
MALDLAGRHAPDELQARGIVRRDLLQRAEAPAVIGAAEQQPVGILRVLQPFRCDRRVLLQDPGIGPGTGVFDCGATVCCAQASETLAAMRAVAEMLRRKSRLRTMVIPPQFCLASEAFDLRLVGPSVFVSEVFSG